MKKISRTVFMAALLAMSSPVAAQEFTGRFTPDTPHDGDTFWLCDAGACTKIRLCGIDAPERSDPAGPASTAALASILTDASIRCVQVGNGTPCDGLSRPTNGDRIVAQCFAEGEDVARHMVQTGNACDWKRFSGGAYAVAGGCQK